MDKRTTAFWILGIMGGLFVVGFVVWFLFPTSTPAPTPTGQTPSFPQASIGNQGSGGSVVQPPNTMSLPDPEREQEKFFALHSAKKLSLVRIDSTSSSFGDTYGLYADDIAYAKTLFPQETSFSIGVAELDLNADGIPERFAYVDLPGFCGTAGCPLDVYQKQGNGWKKILSVMAQGAVGVEMQTFNGYSNLLITEQGGIGYRSRMVEYTYGQGMYVPSAMVATWNGSTFN